MTKKSGQHFRKSGTKHNVYAHQRTGRQFRIHLMSLNIMPLNIRPLRCPDKQQI